MKAADMRCRQTAIAFALALAAMGGSACAMSTASNPAARCAVTGPDQLVAALGGSDALCAIFVQATASGGSNASVHLEVLNAHAAVARATIEGRQLAERRIDSADRPLTGQAIESLAKAVADQLHASRHAGSAS